MKKGKRQCFFHPPGVSSAEQKTCKARVKIGTQRFIFLQGSRKAVIQLFVLVLLLANLATGICPVAYGAQVAKQVEFAVSNQSIAKVLEGTRVTVREKTQTADRLKIVVLTSKNFEVNDLQKASIDNFTNVTGAIKVKSGKERFEGLFVITYTLEGQKWKIKDAAKNVFVTVHSK